ncbi:radial spoke head 14 homolog [Sitophilus oryzae]|uniref:Radial spoke head 14 homolog n=1 Tax=Sitophilus oryzae TaxID=7048 RepID=A0A6J2XVP2_SITOR|nr:radial spoke head 14 homolog [Sitophilus oryzae]
MYSCHKNSYLHGNTDINAGIINRLVERAWDGIHFVDEYDRAPPFNRLTSEQPCIPVKNVDCTRRPQGFGRWAMPKLRRELHDKDAQVILAALTSICDLIHDPERGYEAIHLGIVERLVDHTTHELPTIRERSTHLLKVLAELAEGKEAIVENPHLLANLIDNIDDEFAEVRVQTAACIEMVAAFWKTADVLVENGLIQVLLANLNDKPEVVQIHLETLKHLIYCNGKKIVIENDGFSILVKLLQRDESEILAKTCTLLSILCSIKEGRKLASKEFNLLLELNRLLHDERELIHTAAAETIMFCTIKSAEKITASKINSMPKRLVQLTNNRLNGRTQMFAMKALTNICEHPLVRKEVSTKYYFDIENSQLSEDIAELQKYKNTLMGMLKWVPETKDDLTAGKNY